MLDIFARELVETKNRAKREWILDLHSPGDQTQVQMKYDIVL